MIGLKLTGRRLWALGALALVAAVGIGAASRLSLIHVQYYTGDPERTERMCLTCHVYANGGTLLDRLREPQYLTPFDVAVAGDGRVLVTTRDTDELIVVDPTSRRVARRIEVGRRPHSVVVGKDDRMAYVTLQYANEVAVVDLDEGEKLHSLATGGAPAGLALDGREERIVVANWLGDDISVLDNKAPSEASAELVRLAGGVNPNHVAASPDGQRILVTSELSHSVPYPGIPVSEITLVDLERGRVDHRFQIDNGHLIEGIAFAPDGRYAIAVMIQPKNLLPVLQVERGWTMANAMVVLDTRAREAWQLPLDDIDRFYADPADIAIDPSGQYAFVSHGGVDQVTVVDLPALIKMVEEATPAELAGYRHDLSVSRRYIEKRIPVGSNPQGLAVSPDGRFVYVAERFDDRIGVIDTEVLERVDAIDLGGPEHVTVVRHGAKMFHSAGRTLQNQFSCRSCHPDQHVDRLQYDFEPDGLGRNVLDNRSLRGLRGTAPFKWNGKNTSLYMQCGIRFARILTRSQPFDPDELNSLVAFIMSREAFPNPYRQPSGELTPAQSRGKDIFERTRTSDGETIPVENRCTTCHPAPLFTNLQKADIDTRSPGDSAGEFDNPHLRNIWMSAPYLHDGKARTLEEIWTVHSEDDTHGVVNDVGKSGLNDLVEYLKTL